MSPHQEGPWSRARREMVLLGTNYPNHQNHPSLPSPSSRWENSQRGGEAVTQEGEEEREGKRWREKERQEGRAGRNLRVRAAAAAAGAAAVAAAAGAWGRWLHYWWQRQSAEGREPEVPRWPGVAEETPCHSLPWPRLFPQRPPQWRPAWPACCRVWRSAGPGCCHRSPNCPLPGLLRLLDPLRPGLLHDPYCPPEIHPGTTSAGAWSSSCL